MDSNDTQVYDILIIGGGPAGIEAALQAKKLGLTYLLLEKKYMGSLIRDTMAEKKFYHVYGRNTAAMKGDLVFPDRVKGDELVALWHEQAASLHTKIATVLKIEKVGDLFHITTTNITRLSENEKPCFQMHQEARLPHPVFGQSGGYQAKKVILTSGTFENPRKLHVPGEDGHENIFYALDYYNDYVEKTIIVVGGGNSALETAIYHAERNKIILIVRKDHFTESVTPKNTKDVEDMAAEGKIAIWWQSKIIAIEGQTATVDHAGVTEQQPFDFMFIHAGYEKPLEFLKSAGIEIEESLGGGKPKCNEQFETNVPGLFIAGGLTGADSVIESANQAYDIVHHILSSFSYDNPSHLPVCHPGAGRDPGGILVLDPRPNE